MSKKTKESETDDRQWMRDSFVKDAMLFVMEKQGGMVSNTIPKELVKQSLILFPKKR